MSKCVSCAVKLKTHEKEMCYKCCAELISQMRSDAPLLSEVLMYAEFHRNGATKENLVNTMCGFFSNEEIKSAKNLLYDRYGDRNLLQNQAERRTTETRSDLMATCCDVIDDLFKLEENDITVICAASNWKRLPKINPEEVTNISIADKLAKMEAKFAIYDSALSDVKAHNSKVDIRVRALESNPRSATNRNKVWPSIVSTNEGKRKEVPPARVPLPQVPASVPNMPTSVPNVPASVPNVPAGVLNVPADVPEAPHTVRNALLNLRDTSDDGSNTIDDGPAWSVYRPNSSRRRGRTQVHDKGPNSRENSGRDVNSGFRRRRGALRGQSTKGGLGAGPLPVRDFFIYRVNKSEGVEAVRDHMKTHNIIARDIVAKNMADSKYSSFKVSVDVVDKENMMNPDMWPVGMCIRKWRDYSI